MAATAAVVLLATGLYESGRHIPDLRSVAWTVYGLTVAGKVVLVAAALTLAGINTLLVHPRLAAPVGRILAQPAGWAPVSLRRFTTVVAAEALVLGVAVGAAALLTSVPTAREIDTATRVTAPPGANVDGLFVTFEQVPAGPEKSRLIVRARATVKPEPGPVSGVEVVLVGPTGTTITVVLEPIEPGRYEAETAKPTPGPWKASVAVQREDLPAAVVKVGWSVAAARPDGARPLEVVTTGLAILLLTALVGAVGFTRHRREHPMSSTAQVGEKSGSQLMRKALAVTLAAALFVSLLASAASAGTNTRPKTGKLAHDVQEILTSLPPGDMTTVVVTLRDRADLATVRGATRAARLRNVIQALQTTASTSQVQIRTLLRARDSQGKVARTKPLWIFNGISVTATAEVIQELATRADVASVTPDEVRVVPAAEIPEPNLSAVDAPALWDLGHTGQGVVVASLDSGVDVTHPDLASRWRGGTNSWYDPYGEHATTPTDLSGHGTATIGVIVGGDAGGTSIGMAPGATWIAAKIFDDNGGATATAVHQAFQWVLDPDHDPNTNDAPQVVNGSWSIGAGPGCDLSFQPDLQALRTAGIVPVFAAGNYGPSASTSVSPANYPEAVAVGAVNNQDLIYSASSRGPSTCGGRASVFPDLVTPGVDIHTSDRYGLFQTATGTSLSAPHASGALALLLGAIPGLSLDRQLTALTQTAHDLGPSGPDTGYGYGRLDVLAAYQWLQAQPDFGVALAPTAASVSPGEGVTYTVEVTPANGFGADVSLSLSGLPAAQASWSFTPDVVPVGSGTSQLNIVTSTAIPPGSYPLTVTASSGTISRTASATLTVTPPPDFTLAVAPAVATVNAGSSASFTVSIGPLNGFAGTVALYTAGLPASVGSAALTPASLVGLGTAQLSVVTVTSAPEGAYPITVTATSGTTVHTATVSLTVRARDFALSVSPVSASVARGGVASYQVRVAAVGRFTSKVTLSRSGVPWRATTLWSKNPVVVPGSSTLRVKTSTSTTRGTYTLVITGTSGAISHRVAVTLTVT